jgi:hypothetical protein
VPDAVVVDTNVVATSNNVLDAAILPCASRCAKELLAVRDGGRLVLDEGGEILAEYRRNASSSGQPGPGDAFLRWVLTNRTNPERCVLVVITHHDARGYEEFPGDSELDGFDYDDRKFVGAAISSGTPRDVLLALDTDWYPVREALARHGLQLRFVCPDELEQTLRRKGLI